MHVASNTKQSGYQPRLPIVATAAMSILAMPLLSHAATTSFLCDNGKATTAVIREWEFDIDHSPKDISILLPTGRDIALAATESDIDIVLEVSGGLRADNPVRRTGTQVLLVHTLSAEPIILRARAKPHADHSGRIEIRAYDVDPRVVGGRCRSIVEAAAAADSAYAEGQAVAAGEQKAAQISAADRFGFASQKYQKAYEAAGPASSPQSRAQLAHALSALLYQDLHDWRNSERWASTAADLYGLAGDPYGRARAQALQAAAWMELATLPDVATAKETVRQDSHALLLKAATQLQQLAQFHANRMELYDEALQLNNIGLARYYQGSYDDAIRGYLRAIPIYAQLGERYRQAQVLQNIAVVNSELGRFAAAALGYKRALELLSSDDSPKLYGEVLNNCALANLSAGHLEEALQQSGDALELFTRIQERREQARSLYGIARVYAAAGNYPLAEEFLQQALDTRSAALDARGRVDTLRALAFVAEQEGRKEDALRFNREALALAVDPPVRVRILVRLAESQSVLGDDVEAARFNALAEAVARKSDPASRATVALERSALESRAGHLLAARGDARHALATFGHLGLDNWRFDTYVAIANIDHQLGRTSDALDDLDHAIHLSDHIRNEASGSDLRAGLMQSLRPAFDLKIALLATAIKKAENLGDSHRARLLAQRALMVAERYRARAMRDIALARFDYISNEEFSDLRAAKSALLGQIAVQRHQLQQHGAIRSNAHKEEASSELARLLQKMTSLDARIASLGSVFTSPSYQDIDLTRQLASLPSNVALIAYWFTPSTLYVWVANHERLQFRELGDASSIRAAAFSVHESHRAVQSETASVRLQASRVLATAVLEPVLSAIPAGTSRLVIVPDGPLHYVPFASLPMSAAGARHYLVEQFDVAYAPGIARVLSNPPPRQTTNGRMLLIADAVYGPDDSRWPITSARRTSERALAASQPHALGDAAVPQNYARLPGTAVEAATIARRLPADQVDRLEGFNASRAGVLGHPLETYRYIHFAVHGTTDADIPQLSSIVLSSYNEAGDRIENRVWAGDLLLRRLTADTVVFSACDTALGKRVAGEGLVGLRYMALARGAHAVVASLWPVPDRATSDLMDQFYGQLLDHHLRADQALADAMRRVIATGLDDPALWAAFTVTVSAIAQ
jgi:CHAT domain-containing protein